METQVTVIGAGPVGLTLAMDLASRGVDVPILYEHARTFDRIKLVGDGVRSLRRLRRRHHRDLREEVR